MTIYKVLHYPHALLKKKASAVEKFTDELRQFIKDLTATAYEFEGGGIASVQVGVCKRIFICDFSGAFKSKSGFEKKEGDFLVFDKDNKPMEYSFPMTFINPEIIETTDPIKTTWEGCLSFPNVESYDIPRFHGITVRAQNELGETFTVKTTHLYASVNFQHEIDHLDGITMIDHWKKSDYSEKDVISDIKNYEDEPQERKRIKKLKLVDAHKIKFDFL